ncbi:MAG: DUF5719 family protein [Actinomycetota bacterium]
MSRRRVLFVAFLAALLAAGLVAGRASDPDRSAAVVLDPTALRPGIGGSTAWFCPGLPPAVDGDGARLTVTNLGRVTADLVITVFADGARARRRGATVAATATRTFLRRDLGPPGTVVVESRGAPVVVEEGVNGDPGTEIGPCASEAATQWHFAAGTTRRGVEQWLVLANPFATDARVDVTFRTDAGVRRPERLQGLDLLRRSRIAVPVQRYAVRAARVAVDVRVTFGRVVAAQTVVFTPTSGSTGIATSLGAPAPAGHWWFAGVGTEGGTESWIAVASPGSADTKVTVQALPGGGEPVQPVTVGVGRDEVVWVRLGRCTGDDPCLALVPGARYGLDVRADRDVPVVAQTLGRAVVGSGRSWAASLMGVARPGPRWALAATAVRGAGAPTVVAVANPGSTPVRAVVSTLAGAGRAATRRAVTVAAGREAMLTVPGRGGDTGVLVDADRPVVVGRIITGESDITTAPGIRRP